MGVLETLLATTFRSAVPNADTILRGMGNVFQRLDDAAGLFDQHLGGELRALAGAERWERLVVAYAQRHVLVHNNGLIDQRFLERVRNTRLGIGGQRLVVTRDSALSALDDAEHVVNMV